MAIIDPKIEPDVLSRLYALLKTIRPTLHAFVKREKYCLGQKIEDALLCCCESVCHASHEEKGWKTRPLICAMGKADLARILIRLAYEQELIKESQYLRWATELVEISKMLGGWLRFERTR